MTDTFEFLLTEEDPRVKRCGKCSNVGSVMSEKLNRAEGFTHPAEASVRRARTSVYVVW